MAHSTDREMAAALEADADKLRALGQGPGLTVEEILGFWSEPRDTPGWYDDDYEPSN